MSDSEEEYEYDYGSDADSMPDDDVSGSDKSGDEGSAENEKKSVKKIKIEIVSFSNGRYDRLSCRYSLTSSDCRRRCNVIRETT